MIDHIRQGGEAAVVVKAAFGTVEEAAEGSGAIFSLGGALRLEVIDADLACAVHGPARLGEERRDVAGGASGRAGENCLAALGGVVVIGIAGRNRWWNGDLIEM